MTVMMVNSDSQFQPGISQNQNQIMQLTKKQNLDNKKEINQSSGHLGYFVMRTCKYKKKELNRNITKDAYITNCRYF